MVTQTLPWPTQNASAERAELAEVLANIITTTTTTTTTTTNSNHNTPTTNNNHN